MSTSKNNLSDARKKWEETVLAKILARAPEREECKEIPRIVDPSDIENFDYIHDLNYPGLYPFTRGVQPTMYKEVVCGRCDNMPDSVLPKNQTNVTAIC